MATSDTPMRERLTELLNQWTMTQKVTMVAVVGLTLAGLLYIAYSASAPNYRTLFRNLSPETSSKIVETLEQKQIPFKLDGGSNIQVPEDQVHHTRLMLAGLDLPGLEGDGFELFDKNEFGMTAFTQKVNYKRAMEAELARTIRHLEPINRVRVHLVLPEKALFKDDQNPPSASIVVGLIPGSKLKPSQIKSIQYLASSSVEGLEASNVAIVDQYGATLAKPHGGEAGGVDPGDQAETVNRLESDYEKRVVAMLAPLVGRENVRATVRVEVDSTRVTETSELYDPDKTVVRREQRSEESDSSGGANGDKGIAGVGAQLRGAQAQTVPNPANKSRVNEVVDYEVNKTVRQTVRSGVRVERISVAVLFNDAVRLKAAAGDDAKKEGDAAAEGAKEGEEAKKEGEDGKKDDAAKAAEGAAAAAAVAAALDMKRVEALVKSAVGFDASRGDSIEIVREDFHMGPEVAPSEPLPFWQEPAFLAAAMRNAVMLFVALLLALFVLRPIARSLQPPKPTKAELAAQAKANREPKQVVGRTVAEIENEMVSAELVDEDFGEDGMLPLDPVQEAQKRLRAEVIDLGTGDIDRTSQVISEWIRMG